MYLEVHHHQVVAIMHSKELQLTMKSSLVQFAKTLMINFYVDDLLKSTPGAQSAISLVKAVTKRCKASGFKLGKFISNNTVVLKSLQEDQRRKGVKDSDLSSGEMLVEKALGVRWNIDEDSFGFKTAGTSYKLWDTVNFEFSLQSFRLCCTIHSRRLYSHPKTMQRKQCLG